MPDIRSADARGETELLPERVVRGSYRWIGVVLFVGVSWLYAASGLVAPIWAVGVLWALWLGSLVYLIRVWRSDSRKVVAVPIVGGVIWAVVMLAGSTLLDWSA